MYKKGIVYTDIFVDIYDSRRQIYYRLLHKGKQVRTKYAALRTHTNLEAV
jgi:hypothetical protein